VARTVLWCRADLNDLGSISSGYDGLAGLKSLLDRRPGRTHL